MTSLKIITSTTRPGRKGTIIANWITEVAKKTNLFNVELLDLAEINLPFLDEPNHPRLQQYQNQHTIEWSRMISGGDCYIVVLSEYNFGFPAPIKNAFDYLYNEWTKKPVAFVSYGGVSGGIRATEMFKPVVSAFDMVPIVESVIIPFFNKLISDEDEFTPNDIISKSAQVMLAELEHWSVTLKGLREQKKTD
jgi:NAD(P)H-dependent FMN reductase